MKRYISILFIIVFLVSCGGGKDSDEKNATGSVSGSVTDNDTGAVLSGVKVKLEKLEVDTDGDGLYEMKNIEVGENIISASKFGYVDYSNKIGVTEGENISHDIVLLPSAVQMPNEGLVAYYPFKGDAKDKSANSNHGLVFGATLIQDRFGAENNAYDFDGIDDYIELKNSDSLDTKNAISIFAWIKSQGSAGPILNYCTNCWGVHLWETAGISGNELFVRFTDRNLSVTTALRVDDVLVDGEWAFVGATYDSNTGVAKLWLNGNEIENINIGKFDLSTQYPVRIGMRDGDSRVFSGGIDDIYIYNRAITDAEVLKLYHLQQ